MKKKTKGIKFLVHLVVISLLMAMLPVTALAADATTVTTPPETSSGAGAGLEMWAWGWNGYGQLGDDSTEDRHNPTKIGEDWAAVSAGNRHTVALKTDGSLYAWGRNDDGQLGDNSTLDKESPTRIGEDSDWAAVSAGDQHTVALKTDGSLYAWGSNGFDQLGDNTTEGEDTPTRIGGDSNWSAVSAGIRHTVALKTDGSLYAWGYNASGQLGQGNDLLNEYTTPTRIGNDSDWAAVSAGNAHTLALKTGGSLWAWGNNQYGQLGVGDMYANKHTPTRIGEDSDWATVSTGYGHTLALKADGSLWAWGNNNSGQLGGTPEHRDIPTHIGEDEDWAMVSAGSYHTVALKTDSSLWAWGNNSNGELGDGTTEERDTPMLIDDDSDWTGLSAGSGHTLALKEEQIGSDSPAWPAGNSLTASGTTQTSATLNWTEAQDDIAVTGYRIYRDSSLIQTVTGTEYSYIMTGLSSSTNYTFQVQAGDADNQWTTNGPMVTVRTDSSSSGGSSYTPPPIPKLTADITSGGEKFSVEITSDSIAGNAVVLVDEKLLERILENVNADESGRKTILIEMPEVVGANSYTLETPRTGLSSEGTENEFLLITPLGTLAIPDNMLAGQENVFGEIAGITICQGDKSTLSETVMEALGDNPLVQLTLEVDGEQEEWNNPSAPITVSIPYTPTAEELANPEHITIWYIDGEGNVVEVPSGRYDPATGVVTFSTTHFSDYAVVYVTKTFDDIGSVAWAKASIEVLASKGILKGISETEYAPKTNITRADFLYFLVRTLGVEAEFTENFDDISSDTYYYKGIGIAKKLGITNGTGNNKYNPDASITRQDMMTLTERALRMLNMLTEQGTTADLEKFADKALISSYAEDSVAAVVKEGLIIGSGDNINPLENTTRAEAAVFLYRIYNK